MTIKKRDEKGRIVKAPPSTSFSIRLPDTIIAQLNEMATVQSVSRNQLISDIIIEYITDGNCKTAQPFVRKKNE